MSGQYISLYDGLKLSLGRQLGFWDFDDYSFSNPRPIAPLVFNGADRLIDITYRGETHTVAYTRVNIATLMANFPTSIKPIYLPDVYTASDLATAINTRYGIPITAEDIDFPNVSMQPTGFSVPMSADSMAYVGKLVLTIGKVETEPTRPIPVPKYRWLLSGDTASAIDGAPPLTAEFDYVTVGDQVYASHATPRLQSLGVSLPATGEFTLRFKIYTTAVDSVDKWQGIFSDATGGDLGQQLKISCNDVPGKWFVYPADSVWSFSDLDNTAFLPESESSIVVRGIDDRIEFYVNGRLYITTPASAHQYEAWTHIGQCGQYMSSKVLLRDIEYFDTAIDMPVLQSQSVNDATPLTTWGAQPWYLDNVKLDARASPSNLQTRFNPGLTTYPFDFSKYTSFLKTIPVKPRPWVSGNDFIDQTVIGNLGNYIRAITGSNDWFWNTYLSSYNLYGCCVAYNGPTKDCRKSVTGAAGYGAGDDTYLDDWIMSTFTPPNEEYDNVLVLWVKSTYTNYSSYGAVLMLHYND